MLFSTPEAASQAYERFQARYYPGEASSIRCQIKPGDKRGFEVWIYSSNGNFLTIL